MAYLRWGDGSDWYVFWVNGSPETKRQTNAWPSGMPMLTAGNSS
jgi:hypothetical protein